MAGYGFKPYNNIFPQLFEAEKNRLEIALGNNVEIEHFGSTAVPKIAGKGIIDIYVVTNKELMEEVSTKLQEIGYIRKDNAGEKDVRIFHQIKLPDPLESERTYHVHVTYRGNSNLKDCLLFRDYLRNHPEDARRYEGSKKQIEEAVKDLTDKAEIKRIYKEIKDPIIRDIMEKARLEALEIG